VCRAWHPVSSKMTFIVRDDISNRSVKADREVTWR